MSDTSVVETNVDGQIDSQPAAVLPETEPTQQPTEGQESQKEESRDDERTYSKAEYQDAIERASAKAAAKAERRANREAQERLERILSSRGQPQVQQNSADQRPARMENESDDAYFDRLYDWKDAQKTRAREQERVQNDHRSMIDRTEKMYADAEKIAGFDRDEFNEVLQNSGLGAEFAKALIESEQSARVMHFIQGNPDEAKRIGSLSPARQATELGKLEAKLANAGTAKPSSAPAPVNPVGSRGSITADPEKMSMEQYEKWRESQGAITRRLAR